MVYFMLKKGFRYSPEDIYSSIVDSIMLLQNGFKPHLAFFGCSEEVNAESEIIRHKIFDRFGGIFTTRMIGSQVFYHQLKVSVSRGHTSNVFEVNVHIGEIKENNQIIYGHLIGRDGKQRATCGALCHILDDFVQKPDEQLSISQSIDGELYIDFIATIKFRLRPHIEYILNAENRFLAITYKNLEVQMNELIRQLQKILFQNPEKGPMFAIGTFSFNRNDQTDKQTIEYLYMLKTAQEIEKII